MRKPIICIKGQQGAFKYRYCRTGYALDVPIKFLTDLNKIQFERYLKGSRTAKDFENFEIAG